MLQIHFAIIQFRKPITLLVLVLFFVSLKPICAEIYCIDVRHKKENILLTQIPWLYQTPEWIHAWSRAFIGCFIFLAQKWSIHKMLAWILLRKVSREKRHTLKICGKSACMVERKFIIKIELCECPLNKSHTEKKHSRSVRAMPPHTHSQISNQVQFRSIQSFIVNKFYQMNPNVCLELYIMSIVKWRREHFHRQF